jgi:hypothetical protein
MYFLFASRPRFPIQDRHNSLHPDLKKVLYFIFISLPLRGSKIWILRCSVYNQNAFDKQHFEFGEIPSFILYIFYDCKSLNDVYTLSLLLIHLHYFLIGPKKACNLLLYKAVCILFCVFQRGLY